jgi:hypothetical protein
MSKRGQSELATWMMDLERSATEARRDHRLQGIYHKGQEHIWDGREVLTELLERHGGPQCTPEVKNALGGIFSVILWGELAAWRISAQLADRLEPLEAKMAATSQVHDEARHFYVLYDYLKALDYDPHNLDPRSRALLEAVLNEDDLTFKLIGMQLVVEAIAVAIFGAVRRTHCEPVLCELLRYYEKDEARHIGLGIQHLPSRLSAASGRDLARIAAYNVKLVFLGLRSLVVIEPHLEALGISALELHRQAKEKHLGAYDEMWKELGVKDRPVENYIGLAIDSIAEAWFAPHALRGSVIGRLQAGADVWRIHFRKRAAA